MTGFVTEADVLAARRANLELVQRATIYQKAFIEGMHMALTWPLQQEDHVASQEPSSDRATVPGDIDAKHVSKWQDGWERGYGYGKGLVRRIR